MNDTPSFATAILLAAGSGRRMGEAAADKALLPLCGKPVLKYSIDAFAQSRFVDSLIIVYRDLEQKRLIESLMSDKAFRKVAWTSGGDERQDSVWAGLGLLEPDREVVLIHDGARPMVSAATIDAVASAARETGASTAGRRATDTLKRAEYSDEGYQLTTIDRANIWAMETPQGFRQALIVEGYRQTIATGASITDDLSAIESGNHPVALIETGHLNPKLTTPQDLPLFEYLLNRIHGS